MTIKKTGTVLISFFLLCLSTAAHASLYGESISQADLTGTRTFSATDCSSSSGELSGCWPYSFSIEWTIAQDPTSFDWIYTYTLSTTRKAISHFILEISEPSDAMYSIYDVMINGTSSSISGPGTWGSQQGNSNPGLINDFYGIKFDGGGLTATYSFTSSNDPVWGNFYAKSGKDKGNGWIYTYNNALGTSGFDSSNPTDFIPRPDGGSNVPIVPEPVSSSLFVAGGILLTIRRFFLKKQH